MKVWVVLPAYNEEKNLPALFHGFKKLAEDVYNLQLQIIVVNDGSTDNTSAVCHESTFGLAVEVYDNETNVGLADTFMHGMKIAAGKARPEDIIICMDADNSHSPGLTFRLIRNIQEGRDVVIASRYQPGAVVRGVPIYRRMLSLGMSLLFRLVYPIEGVRDYSCGYRAYRASFLCEALNLQGESLFVGSGFSCMAGLLLSLGRLGAICGEVSIILRYDQKEGTSKMRIVQTIRQTLQMLFTERFKRKKT